MFYKSVKYIYREMSLFKKRLMGTGAGCAAGVEGGRGCRTMALRNNIIGATTPLAIN